MTEAHRTIMERLREETSGHHKDAESRTLQRQIAKGTVERGAFVRYLGQLYLVHRTLEDGLREARVKHPAIAVLATSERMRVPDLVYDLEFFEVAPESLLPGRATRRFVSLMEKVRASDPVALLGAFYVVEGSTNGGRFLAQVLHRAWNLDGDGLASLDPYGDRQPLLWGAFKREMNAAAFEPGQVEAIVGMAKRTFEAIAEISDEAASAG
ncbi:MAG: biliverdin-producing heme oxygenase [Thermoanaerobaculales bacterium]|jgi:heme oxygenase|nr:biliverdin-producing heme oxygenase [Thermoanaerobaculales bacterium]